jgi:hypothetical protein
MVAQLPPGGGPDLRAGLVSWPFSAVVSSAGPAVGGNASALPSFGSSLWKANLIYHAVH